MVQVFQIIKDSLDMICYRQRRITVANLFQMLLINTYWLNDLYSLKNIIDVERFNIQIQNINFSSIGQNNITLNISNKRLNKCIDQESLLYKRTVTI